LVIDLKEIEARNDCAGEGKPQFNDRPVFKRLRPSYEEGYLLENEAK
jgi:hypothetical protein